jgi:hypothetical protein
LAAQTESRGELPEMTKPSLHAADGMTRRNSPSQMAICGTIEVVDKACDELGTPDCNLSLNREGFMLAHSNIETLKAFRSVGGEVVA